MTPNTRTLKGQSYCSQRGANPAWPKGSKSRGFSNPQRYGFLLKREHLYPAIPYTEVTVTTGIDNLAQFAKNKGITYAQLKDANPWLRDTSLMNKSGRTYILKIPTQAGMHYDPRKTIPYNKNWVIN